MMKGTPNMIERNCLRLDMEKSGALRKNSCDESTASSRLQRILALLGMAMFPACLTQAEPGEESGARPAVSWEEFKSSVTRSVDGHDIYVVEWDQAVSERELRQRYEAYVARAATGGDLGVTEQQSTVNQVRGVDDVWRNDAALRLTYSVSNTFGANKSRVVSEMAQATLAWQQQARVAFTYLPAH